jgi:hypothetical protein
LGDELAYLLDLKRISLLWAAFSATLVFGCNEVRTLNKLSQIAVVK